MRLRRRFDPLLLGISALICVLGLALALLAVRSVHELPTCESVTGNIDGTGGTECREPWDFTTWPGEDQFVLLLAVVLSVVAVVLAVLARRMRQPYA